MGARTRTRDKVTMGDLTSTFTRIAMLELISGVLTLLYTGIDTESGIKASTITGLISGLFDMANLFWFGKNCDRGMLNMVYCASVVYGFLVGTRKLISRVFFMAGVLVLIPTRYGLKDKGSRDGLVVLMLCVCGVSQALSVVITWGADTNVLDLLHWSGEQDFNSLSLSLAEACVSTTRWCMHTALTVMYYTCLYIVSFALTTAWSVLTSLPSIPWKYLVAAAAGAILKAWSAGELAPKRFILNQNGITKPRANTWREIQGSS